MAQQILIKNGFVLTMDEENSIIEDGAVLVETDKIVAVGDSKEIEKSHQADLIIDATMKAVMPGLVDLHYHSSLGRGIGDNLSLDKFLNELLYPKIRTMNAEEAYWGALCGYIEAIKNGTTTVNDQWRQMEACGDAAEKAGIRAVLSNLVADEEVNIDTLVDNERLYKEKHGVANERIRVFFGIEWVPLSSQDTMLRARKMADKYYTGIHIHLNESQGEIEMSLKRHRKRPTVLAHDTGILGPDCIAAHCVWLSDEEIELIAKTKTNIAHNPVSNAKIGNGIARVPEYFAAGINIGLGHDSAVCNNSRDMFEQMKWAALIHRAARADSSVMSTNTVLRMATVNGGKALHQDTGILKPGMKADIIMVNLKGLHFIPLVTGTNTNLKAHLVYSAHGEDVDTSIIDGRIVMANRVLQTVREEVVMERANAAFLNVLKRMSA